MELEHLAIVFACQEFDQYIFGKHVQVETDHKPLEIISHSNVYRGCCCSYKSIPWMWRTDHWLALRCQLAGRWQKFCPEHHWVRQQLLDFRTRNRWHFGRRLHKGGHHKYKRWCGAIGISGIPWLFRMWGRALDVVYWPGVGKDIKKTVHGSVSSLWGNLPSFIPKEKLSASTWDSGKTGEKVGMDLLRIKGKDCLIIVDYLISLSCQELPDISASSQCIVVALKQQFVELHDMVYQFGCIQTVVHSLPLKI